MLWLNTVLIGSLLITRLLKTQKLGELRRSFALRIVPEQFLSSIGLTDANFDFTSQSENIYRFCGGKIIGGCCFFVSIFLLGGISNHDTLIIVAVIGLQVAMGAFIWNRFCNRACGKLY